MFKRLSAPRHTQKDREQIAPVNIYEYAVNKMMGCKQIVSYWSETGYYRKTEVPQKVNVKKISSRTNAAIGANRGIYQTILKCFPTMLEELNGLVKEVVKETLQMYT